MLFAFRWCLEQGCPHPDYIPLDARQFMDWCEYYELEPWGDWWRQSATVAWMLSKQLKFKVPRTLTVEDFMPVRPRPPQQAVAAKVNQYFKALMAYGKQNDRQHGGGGQRDG